MTTRITTPFTAESTAAEVLADIDLFGRRAVVAGGTSGIGVATARASLATADAEVTLVVRNLTAGRSRRTTSSPALAVSRSSSLRWTSPTRPLGEGHRVRRGQVRRVPRVALLPGSPVLQQRSERCHGRSLS
jgi:NAD(P)-dependent dehydrogenase (short-subunit alcohol dehydrogenase family)